MIARRTVFTHGVALAIAIAAIGCGGSDDEAAPAAAATLVGSLSGSDARVGLVVDDTRGVLYVCGGDATRASLTRWFAGARTAAGLDWTTGDLRVQAAPKGASWSGELKKADGTVLAFEVTPVAAGTIAGLYDAKLPEGRAGVVVFQASAAEPATILGAFKTTGGLFEQVLPVREVLRTGQGIEVKVPSVATSFFVQPVSL